MPPFVAKENFVTTLCTDAGSLFFLFDAAWATVGLASSLSCYFEMGLGYDSCLSREPGLPAAFYPSVMLGNGLVTKDLLF